MRRKMMSRENVPNNSTTNGGNGAYMNMKRRMDVNKGVNAGIKEKGTATGRSVPYFNKKGVRNA